MALVICCVAGPLAILYWLCPELAEPFGKPTQVALTELLVQVVLVVGAYFLACAVTFADRIVLGKVRVNRLTAFLAAIVLILFALAQWCWFRPNLDATDRKITFLFAWLIASFLVGLFVWWRIRRTEPTVFPGTSEGRSQFSIGSILAWLTLAGMFVAVITQSQSLPFPPNWNAIMDPPAELGVCLIVLPLIALPLTRWLIRTRYFVLVAAGVWVIMFAVAWIVFCFVGLERSEYDARDGYFTKIAAFSMAAMLYLAWIGAVRTCFGKRAECQTSVAFGSVRRIALGSFSIVSIGLWGFLAFWFVSNFVTRAPERSLAHFDDSPVIMKELENAYGSEAIKRVQAEHGPQTLDQWLNCLGRDLVPKEQDLLYQIASLTKLEFFDAPEAAGENRRLMGFTPEQIALLPDETFAGWLFANRTDPDIAKTIIFESDFEDIDFDVDRIDVSEFESRTIDAPWDKFSMPLAARFCREKQAVFGELREIVAARNEIFFPVSTGGYFFSYDILNFAANMLFADTRFAVAKNDLSAALHNLGSISRFANTIPHGRLSEVFIRQRIQARAMGVLIHIAEVNELDKATIGEIRKIASRLKPSKHDSATDDAARFAQEMLQSRGNMSSAVSESNYLLLGQKPMASLIAVHPQVIDWNLYITACKQRFDRFRQLREKVLRESRHDELLKIALANQKEEWQFHEHASELFDFPANRSQQIVNTLSSFDHSELRLHVIFALLAKLRQIALELLLHRQEHASFPESLEQLGIDTLDPFSSEPLIYRQSAERFQLYSAGLDGIDNGGDESTSDDRSFYWPAASIEEYLE